MSSGARLVDMQGQDIHLYLDIVNGANRRQWGEAAKELEPDDIRVEATKSENDQRYYLWWVDDLAIGALELLLHRDDPVAGWIQVNVREDYEGYRVGTRLLEFGEELARRSSRSYLRGMSAGRSLRDDRATRFLKKAGYHEINSLLRQDLILPSAKLDACHMGSAEGLDAVIVSGVPELSICAEICALWVRQYSEDPAGAAQPPEYSPHGLQEFQRRIVASGRYTQFTMLIEKKSGAVVGVSEMDYRPGEAFAEQFESYIDPEFRSPAALNVMKCTGTRGLIEACPDVPRIRTLNSTKNVPMIEVNAELGFTNTGYYREWEKRLS